MRLVISHIAISKSICGNLNNLDKDRVRSGSQMICEKASSPFEKPWHSQGLMASTRRGSPKIGGASMLPWYRDMRVHLVVAARGIRQAGTPSGGERASTR